MYSFIIIQSVMHEIGTNGPSFVCGFSFTRNEVGGTRFFKTRDFKVSFFTPPGQLKF